MSAAVVNLVELVVEAINDAAAEGAFAQPVTAQEDYALTLPMEAIQEWRVAVQPGPSRNSPMDLQGAVSEQVSARIVLFYALEGPQDVVGIKAGLLLVQQITDEVCSRLEIGDHNFISSAPETQDGQVYDQARLRDSGIFDAQWLLSFEMGRSP